MKAATTCFGLQGNHHQGATSLNTVHAYTVHNTHATQVILCCHDTDNVCTTSVPTLNQACMLSKVLVVVP
jgi:hypothetical protein